MRRKRPLSGARYGCDAREVILPAARPLGNPLGAGCPLPPFTRYPCAVRNDNGGVCNAGLMRVWAFLILLAGCTDRGTLFPVENPGAMVDVTGTYDFFGSGPQFGLFGTITFQQTGNTVQVVSTTYANSNDRPLMGVAELAGNRLDIMLVPVNGDMDFEAQVTFLFTEDSGGFVVSFLDTNGDSGPLGSYQGARR